MLSPSHFIEYEEDFSLPALKKDLSFASILNSMSYSFATAFPNKTVKDFDEEPVKGEFEIKTVPTPDNQEMLEQSTGPQTPGYTSNYVDSASGSDYESPKATAGSDLVDEELETSLAPLRIPVFAADVHRDIMNLLGGNESDDEKIVKKKAHPKRKLPKEYEEDLPIQASKEKKKAQKLTEKKQKNIQVEPSTFSRKAEKTSSKKKQSKLCDEKRAKSQPKTKKSASSKAKSKKLSIPMTKNYKGIVSTGLARLLLEADLDLDCGLYQMLINLLQDEIQNHQELQRVSIEDFFNDFMDYVKKELYGKNIKETLNGKKSEAFKVGNVANILRVLYPQREDSTKTKAIKRVLRALLVDHFFESKYYYECITRWCKAKPQGKLFLWLKLPEIKKVFENPSGDLIEFSCDNTALLGEKNFPFEDFIDFMKVFMPIAASNYKN